MRRHQFSDRVWIRRRGLARDALLVLAVFFPSIWFIDSIVSYGFGREGKMIIWAAVFCCALLVAARELFALSRLSRLRVCNQLMLFLSCSLYFLLRFFVDPPIYDYQQLIGVSLLCPVAFAFGAACRGGTRVILGALGVSVAAMVLLSILIGTYDPFAEHWQYLVTASTAEARSSSGYQGLSAMAGFAAVSLLHSFKRPIRNALLLIVFFCIPVLVGGRGAIAAMLVTVGIWGLSLRPWLTGLVVLGFGCLCLAVLRLPASAEGLLPLGISRMLYLLDVAADEQLRVQYLQVAGELWLADPLTFLFGVGPQGFQAHPIADGPGSYPHNFVLEGLCEFGLVGTSLLLLPLATALTRPRDSVPSAAIWFVIYLATLRLTSFSLSQFYPVAFACGWYWSEGFGPASDRNRAAIGNLRGDRPSSSKTAIRAANQWASYSSGASR
jgi:hypothetical protein